MNASPEHQGGVDMAEPVKGQVWQPRRSHQLCEPLGSRVRVDGPIVGSSEDEAGVLPSGSNREALFDLPAMYPV